jgi:hypothetical protein
MGRNVHQATDHREEWAAPQQKAITAAKDPNIALINNKLLSTLAASAVTTGLAVGFAGWIEVAGAAPVPWAPTTEGPVAKGAVCKETIDRVGTPGQLVELVELEQRIVTVLVMLWVTVAGRSNPPNLAQSSTLSPSMQQKPATGAQYEPFSQYPKSVLQHDYLLLAWFAGTTLYAPEETNLSD